ncbi:MAG: hypothetical protein ACLUOI_08100 [Eisenbergiella sp.]
MSDYIEELGFDGLLSTGRCGLPLPAGNGPGMKILERLAGSVEQQRKSWRKSIPWNRWVLNGTVTPSEPLEEDLAGAGIWALYVVFMSVT